MNKLLDTEGEYQAKDISYVLRKGRDKIYLAYSDYDGSQEAENMAKFIKDSYLKIVVVPFDIEPWKDENGKILACTWLLF